jgi:hydrogenase nickel incorporation protein HypA/HybF
MHELSLARNILDIIRDCLPNQQKILKEVHVHIGALMAVVPESLQFCYKSLTQDTPYESSKMIITILPTKVICEKCQLVTELKDIIFVCPECGENKLKTLQGNELIVSHLEVS